MLIIMSNQSLTSFQTSEFNYSQGRGKAEQEGKFGITRAGRDFALVGAWSRKWKGMMGTYV